ncbi:hypothetical protein [Oceanithermus profundus]|uniref:Uncharacterized protein n=1 Tax=Oceanithermus profundus (strain DSM 14977 / NBRC 100410 / VKM B-2274 / 506) TaxID=670487 RepID=E4U876_OCEP5|nr:hypothetical protein [Oceanithermus profundus]ADR36291.1 hypothetical protein Ocepr_0834 [Oceanithermus profundus DSM 14977]
MAYEEGPEAFAERFAEYAVAVELLPQPFGYPLLEAVTPVGVLYPFDRGAPPSPSGPVELVLHAVVASFRYRKQPPGVQALAGGRHRLCGRVQREIAPGFYLLDCGLPLVLASDEPLETGMEIEVTAEPPLMAFRSEGGRV